MQFNRRHGKIESFGAHLICFRDNYVKLLQEQEAKYQETKKYYKDNNIDKYVYYDAGFMRVADNFPGFSFVNKTYSAADKYYLVIKDTRTGLETLRQQFTIDIAFSGDFGFSF